MSASIRIYQNFIKADQREKLDSAFVPFDWTGNPYPDYREIGIFNEFVARGLHQSADYVGMFSSRYFEKTRVPGKEFIQFIAEHPGHDVYFINPFPQLAYASFNSWEQGEEAHPGLCALTQLLFDQCGYDIRISELGRMDQRTLLYSNYWVGSRAFWDHYMGFIGPLFRAITTDMPAALREKFFVTVHHETPSGMFPFVFERMLSTLLLTDPGISGCAYRYPCDEIGKRGCEGEQDVVAYFGSTIDEWDREGVYPPNRRLVFAGLTKFLSMLSDPTNYNNRRVRHARFPNPLQGLE
jgi:hypothetical protein